MKPTASRSIVWSVQYLRAFAAIAVVIFHQQQTTGWMLKHGVDLFFVISGFIMFSLTDNPVATSRNFALDRVARIIPSYWIATLIAFMIASTTNYSVHLSPDLALFGKSLLFMPARNPVGLVQPTLYLGWTLNMEMFFYSLFAIILITQRFRLMILGAILVGLALIGLIFRPQHAMALTYTSPLLLEFLAGVLLGKLFGITLANASQSIQLVGSLTVAAALAAVSRFYPSLIFGALAVLLVAGGLLQERRGKVPKILWLKSLGDASFAIYLYQQFAFDAVRLTATAAWNAVVHRVPPSSVVHVISAIAAIGLGVLVLQYVERPATKAAKAMLRRLSGEPVRLAPSGVNSGDPEAG